MAATRNRLVRALAGVSLASIVLAGCSAPEEEEVPKYTSIPGGSTSAAEPISEATDSPTSAETAPTETPAEDLNLPESVHGIPLESEVKKATAALLAASDFVEGNSVGGKYDQWLYYATSPGDTIRMRILPHASSPESYCLQATSDEDPDLSILYDSQQGKVLANGDHCQQVIGTPWESADGSENDQGSSSSLPPGDVAPTGGPTR